MTSLHSRKTALGTRLAAAALAGLLLVPAARSLCADNPAAAGGGAVAADSSKQNTLTDEQKKAGWKLLFDGKSLDGWHNFKSKGVRPGWQVKDGVLVCVDPKNAGDIVTTDKYDWFELEL